MLTPFSVLLVLSAAFMHASWNALLRGGADRAQSMLIMNVTVGVIGLAMMAFAGLPSAACAVYVVASGLIHLVYNALLVRMYRSGDLGETYPVARGSSPALVALGGSLFAGEWMNLIGAVGIGLVCTGIFMLAAARARSAKHLSGSASDRALQKAIGLHAMNLPAALATGVSIAAYTVVDGLGVRASGNWVAYTGGMFAFFLAMPLWYLARGRRAMFAVPVAEVGKAASGGAISLLAYGAIIWAMQTSPMGAVSALRETSVVFAALLGAAFLGERLTGFADRGVLHHRRRRGLRRLALLIGIKKRPGASRGVSVIVPQDESLTRSILLEEARELLLEPRHAAAAVEHLLGAAGPGRVRLGVDIEVQLVARLAPGRARLVFGAIGHHDRNHMIFRVNFGFHGRSFGAPAPVFNMAVGTDLGRSITQQAPQNKPSHPRFASAGGGAYLGVATAIGRIS